MSSDDTGKAGMEGMEALWRGAKGDKGATGAGGDKGDKGEPGMTRGARRAFIYLLALLLLIAGAGVVVGVRVFTVLEREVQAQCKENADVGGLPVALNPATGKPSLLSVTIVSDARVAWHQAGCPGTLPPAAPSFAHWSRVFKLPG